MATPQPQQPVQLEGADLDYLRQAFDGIEANLSAAAEIAERAMGEEAPPASSLQIAIVGMGSPDRSVADERGSKVIHLDPNGNCKFVTVDPPGYTRPCTAAESTTCLTVANLITLAE
jgi:hypothetical protein